MNKQLIGKAAVTAAIALALSSILNALFGLVLNLLSIPFTLVLASHSIYGILGIVSAIASFIFGLLSIAGAMFLSGKFLWMELPKTLWLIVTPVAVQVIHSVSALLGEGLNAFVAEISDYHLIYSIGTRLQGSFDSIFYIVLLLAGIVVAYIMNEKAKAKETEPET